LTSWAQRVGQVELQDIEVTGMAISEDGDTADVVVAVTWIERDTMAVISARSIWLLVRYSTRASATWVEDTVLPVPMVSGLSELQFARRMLEESARELGLGARVPLGDFGLKRGDGGVEIDFALTLSAARRDELIDGILELEGVRDVRVNE